jgi:hypothetical protein
LIRIKLKEEQTDPPVSIMKQSLKLFIKKMLRNTLGMKNYWKLLFFKAHGYSPNMENPQSLSEKIQWIKVNCNLEHLAPLVDKYVVREFVQKRISEKYLIPLIGVYDRFADVDISLLPEKFVIKATHGCGWNIIVEDKANIDWEKLGAKMTKWLKTNYYDMQAEAPYKNLKGRIIIERYLTDSSGPLKDYKFYCCNGEPLGLHVDIDRFGDHTYRVYDAQFNEFAKEQPDGNTPLIRKPDKWDEMLVICRKLSAGFSFVRVDLYYADGNIFFGELTFTPGSGLSPFDPVSSDYYFGKHFDIRQYTIPPLV